MESVVGEPHDRAGAGHHAGVVCGIESNPTGFGYAADVTVVFEHAQIPSAGDGQTEEEEDQYGCQRTAEEGTKFEFRFPTANRRWPMVGAHNEGFHNSIQS